MSDFLKFLISPLLSQPEELEIKPSTYNISVTVSSDDMGRVIGKNGNVISAIRNLVRAYCISHQQPFTTVTLVEPQSQQESPLAEKSQSRREPQSQQESRQAKRATQKD